MKKTITVLLLAAGMLSASTITFGTGVPGTIEGNSYNGVNVATIPASVWHIPLGTSVWESIQTDSLNPAIPNGEVVDFWFSFTLDGAPLSGSLGLLVDDSARVFVNGYILADNLGSPQGVNCAASKPNCLQPLSLTIPTADLQLGLNRMDVFVSQDGGGQYGIDAFGSVETTPEPAGLILVGMGMLGLGLVRRRSLTIQIKGQ